MSLVEEQEAIPSDRESRVLVRAAMWVGAFWVAAATLLQAYVMVVILPKLPESIILTILGAGGLSRPLQVATPDLMRVSWIYIGVNALVIIVAAVVYRRGIKWPLVLAFFVSVTLPFVSSAVFVSELFQVGLTAPAEHLSAVAYGAAIWSSGVFLLIGIMGSAAAIRWLAALMKEK